MLGWALVRFDHRHSYLCTVSLKARIVLLVLHQSGVNHRILVLARICWATFALGARFLLVLGSLAGCCGQVAAESPLRIRASRHIDACRCLTTLNLLITLKNITEIALLADIFGFTHGAYRRKSPVSSVLLYLRVASL